MLKRVLAVLALVAVLVSPAAAEIWTNVEVFDLPTTTLVSPAQGGGPVEYLLDVTPNAKSVVGWGIEFVYGEDPALSASWASDIRMMIASPNGPLIDVGGFSSVINPWDFQGGGSTDPGVYADDPLLSDPDDNNFFKADPQPKGQWIVKFENDWNSDFAAVITMSDIRFSLYKVPEPTSLGLLAVAGLGLTMLRRRTR